jgi:hypothetical protein
MNNLNQIIFQEINDQFAYGQYGTFTVIIMKSNGFINGTKLSTDGGKRYRDWTANKNTIELIKALQEEGSQNSGSPQILENNGNSITSGTYIHQDLIPHLACWISPSFALKVSKIVNQYMITEFKQKIDEQNDIIEIKSENYVPLLRNEKDPLFVVNRTAEKTINFRCIQKRSYKRHANEILYLETPNAKNILNRLKERMPFKYFTIVLPDTFTEKQLIDVIHEVNNEKYN